MSASAMSYRGYAMESVPLVRTSAVRRARSGSVRSTSGQPSARRHAVASEFPHASHHLLLAVLAALVFALTFFVGTAHASDDRIAQRVAEHVACIPTTTVVVEQGESIWSLAEDYGVEGMETHEVVAWIFETNELASSIIRVGDTIIVPAP